MVLARCGSVGFDRLAGLDSMVAGWLRWLRWLWLVVGEVVVAHRGWGGCGSPWVVLAHYGSIGFDGLAGLDLMVAG